MGLLAHWKRVGMEGNGEQSMRINIYALIGVVLIWLFAISTMFFVQGRECRGQCFQTHDKGCQKRCFDKGVCPIAGGDQ